MTDDTAFYFSNHQICFGNVFTYKEKSKYNYTQKIIQITLSIFKTLPSKFISMPTFSNKLIIFIEQNILICS